ncbi:uncharacterized protein BO95DRAFT_279437 [Aspergillus brunneoviolaceus CBS 621.78]|uniref:Uncharacterized protein n=1 Tax=Aspergillus brunneoviolaceus CBS 621.78 TaxID=1450534 RepID=A0ACD1FVI9_9EURO|nr:hypothetical protein BO95DRAFT_279437 [Aspergillus brunneoviolaceus CBS 621.78]RAH40982.1 hypothetical protein BO95DRAFT_279437 [Aspergillus brunneoviolaceus CBS 621.78]
MFLPRLIHVLKWLQGFDPTQVLNLLRVRDSQTIMFHPCFCFPKEKRSNNPSQDESPAEPYWHWHPWFDHGLIDD